jgi:hypothetical protein
MRVRQVNLISIKTLSSLLFIVGDPPEKPDTDIK